MSAVENSRGDGRGRGEVITMESATEGCVRGAVTGGRGLKGSGDGGVVEVVATIISTAVGHPEASTPHMSLVVQLPPVLLIVLPDIYLQSPLPVLFFYLFSSSRAALMSIVKHVLLFAEQWTVLAGTLKQTH